MIWFAILQTLSPFVHAHINSSNHADINNGLHIHPIHLNIAKQDNANTAINDYALDSHVVVIDKGVIQNLKLGIQACVLIAIFIFLALKTSSLRLRPHQQVKLKPNYLRTSLNPRAPPYF